MEEPRSMDQPPSADITLLQTSSLLQPIMSIFQIPGTATDPTSLGLSKWPDIEPLLDKAINSPSEITQEEKHKIAEWISSRAEMDARCCKYLNRSLDELFEVATTDKDSLTYPDCLMIIQGFHLLRRSDHVGREMERLRRAELHPRLTARWEQARAAVLPDVELRAVTNAGDLDFYEQRQDEYFGRRRKERAEARGRPEPWIQKIIDQGSDMGWGYVIYCHSLDDSQDWQFFRANLDQAIGALPMLGLGADTIRHRKVADLFNFDGQEDDFARLRENFRTVREQGALKPGVLPHVLLYVSSECRKSWTDACYTWLWAVDPDWSHDGPDEDGYDGKVAVNWAVAYDKFYNFMSMGTPH